MLLEVKLGLYKIKRVMKNLWVFKIVVLVVMFLSNDLYSQDLSNVIVFSKTEGYRHKSIETGIESIKNLGNENQFLVQTTEDSDELISMLNNCKVVIFLNTTGNILNEQQQEAFKKFIKNGGGFVGVHAATDTEYEWSWYGKMIGAYFESHPKQQQAIIEVANTKHISTSFLDEKWNKFDEWYNYKNINPNIKVLLKLDEKSYKGGKNGKNHPIAWYQEYEGGKIFYTGLGHTKKSYTNPTFLKHLLGGILYTLN